jgi:hypothetical protein
VQRIVFTVAAAKTKRSSWEYTSYYYTESHPDITAINKLGNDGWDLVSSFSGHDARAPGFIFKRERVK